MVEYSLEAQQQLENIEKNGRFPEDARKAMILKIVAACENCEAHPHRWPAGKKPGTRERRVSPFIIVYRDAGSEVEIVNIWHSSQSRNYI